MKKIKIFFLIAGLLFSLNHLLAQSISVSGSTSSIMSAGTTTKSLRYWITYSGVEGKTISFHYRVDGGSLVPENPPGDGSNSPSYVDIQFTQGNHTVEFYLYVYDWDHLLWTIPDTETKSVTIKFYMYVKNIFDAGNIVINGENKPSGSSKAVKGGDNIQVAAIEQTYGGYDWEWASSAINPSKWIKKKYGGNQSDVSSSQSMNYSVQTDDNATTLEAGLRKVCDVNFRTYTAGSGLGWDFGSLKVNGVTYSSPTGYFEVIEQNAISAEAISHNEYPDINHVFDHWSSGSTISNTTFYPSVHTEYTAYYKGIPNNNSRNLTINWSDPQWTPVQLSWNEHPCTYVTSYQIWRKVKHNGVYGNPELIATVSRSAPNTYTDYEYSITPTYSHDLLHYDVRPYYSVDGTYANPSWVAAYGQVGQKDSAKTFLNELIKDYTIGNYPNPFNPNTKINYQLPQSGYVTIKVYDAIGSEVATLVNEYKESGKYEVDFAGSDLPSGMYIYSMKVNGFTESKKMLLLK